MAGTAVVGNITMDYCRFGSGEKDFVMIPGLSVKAVAPLEELLSRLFAEFTDEYTVWLFDRRTNMPEPCTIEGMSRDTAEVMISLGLKDTYLFGTSQGGMMAQCIAMDHPELVHKLILSSTASASTDYLRDAVCTWIDLAKAGDGYALNENIIDRIYSENTLAAMRDTFLGGGNDITAEEMKRFVNIASSLLDYDRTDEISKIKCRTLVVGCEGDRVMPPEASVKMAQKLGCEFYMYGPEFGHAVCDEAPDYHQRMLDFFAD